MIYCGVVHNEHRLIFLVVSQIYFIVITKLKTPGEIKAKAWHTFALCQESLTVYNPKQGAISFLHRFYEGQFIAGL